MENELQLVSNSNSNTQTIIHYASCTKRKPPYPTSVNGAQEKELDPSNGSKIIFSVRRRNSASGKKSAAADRRYICNMEVLAIAN